MRQQAWQSLRVVVLACALLVAQQCWAGAQQYEPLSAAVTTALSASISDSRPARVQYADVRDRLAYLDWLGEISQRLASRQKDFEARRDLAETVYYEAKRAGLDPALVLGLIQVESNFRKFAVSKSGARGLTQVMPFWTDLIGNGDARRLFDMRVNIRFGCVILRHYLDQEHGDLFRALGRYNGSLGQAEYPNLVLHAWKNWEYVPMVTPIIPLAQPAAAQPSGKP